MTSLGKADRGNRRSGLNHSRGESLRYCRIGRRVASGEASALQMLFKAQLALFPLFRRGQTLRFYCVTQGRGLQAR